MKLAIELPFVACVMEKDDTYFKLSFMKVINVDGEDLYYWPDKPDESWENIVKALNESIVMQKRRKLMFAFHDV